MMAWSAKRSEESPRNRPGDYRVRGVETVLLFIFIILPPLTVPMRIAAQTDGGESSVVSGQQIRVSVKEPIMTLDWQKAFDPGALTIAQAISETLYRRYHDGEIRPHLAASMPEMYAEETFRIRLRPGIRFSNGDVMSERDVIFSLERVKTSTINRVSADLFSRIVAITSQGDGMVEIAFSGSSRELAALLSRTETAILSQRRVAQLGRTYGTAGIEGTGPFTSREWQKGSQIAMEKNANYWAADDPFHTSAQPGQLEGDRTEPATRQVKTAIPYLGTIVVKHETDPGIIARHLVNGSVDIAIGLNNTDVERLGASIDRFDIIEQERPHMVQLYVNRLQPPFDKPQLRKALSWAIDRDRLLSSVSRGRGKIAESVLPASLWKSVSHETSQLASLNQQAVEQVLLEHRQRESAPVSFTLIYTSDPFFERIALELKRQFELAGFLVTLQPREKSAIIGAFYLNSTNWQVILEDWLDWRRLDDPLAYLRVQFETGSPFNKTAFSDERIDKILAANSPETSPERAIPTVLQLIAEDCTTIPLFSTHALIVVSKRLQGVTWSDVVIPFLEKAWRPDGKESP